MDLKLNVSFNFAVIRKYSSLFLPGGIMLAAIVVFGWMVLAGRSLSEQIDKNSIKVGNRIISLQRTAPSSQQYTEVKRLVDAQQSDVDAIKKKIVESSMRQLMSHQIFPEPRDPSQQIFTSFGSGYKAAIERIVKSIGANDAPSDREIAMELGANVSLTGRKPSYRSGLKDTKQEAQQAMLNALYTLRARDVSVYAHPELFGWYGFWDGYKYAGADEAVESCWYSQVALWIYEDVVATIGSLNGGSSNVFDAPVKRLVGVAFQERVDYPDARTGGYGQYASGSVSSGMEDRPVYIIDMSKLISGSVGTGSGRKVMMGTDEPLGVKPWTNRCCNDEIDVVHFSVGVIVANNAISDFMNEICSSKPHTYRVDFAENGQEIDAEHSNITILTSNIQPVERGLKEHERYRYGNNAVSRLDLVCEYMFCREGYDAMKPLSVKTSLGQAEEEEEGVSAPSARPSPR